MRITFKENKRRRLIRVEIIKTIESEFSGIVVIWTGTGIRDDAADTSETFEALMVKDEDNKRFTLFCSTLGDGIEKKHGFSIHVDSLDPEITMEYRNEEYEKRVNKRL